jgi:hypothetical protein
MVPTGCGIAPRVGGVASALLKFKTLLVGE